MHQPFPPQQIARNFGTTAEGQAHHALMLLLGLDPYLKFVVAVDEDVNVFDEEEVLWALATRFQADTDLFMVPQVFCNRLDPCLRDGLSAKLALDPTATGTWSAPRCRRMRRHGRRSCGGGPGEVRHPWPISQLETVKFRGNK
jgi:2,5-furandicarboxylate decarboxylase 1